MFEITILILSVIIGSLLGQFFVNQKSLTKFLLIFSGAFFLATAVLEIFPTIYEEHSHHIGIFVLGGLFFQMIVESLSKGAEHGHVHIKKTATYFPLSIFLGLFIHSFFEGMPVMHQHSHNLLYAIFIHNIPIAMVLYAALSRLNISKWYVIIFMAAFAVAGPLGVIFGNTIFAEYHKEASAFVAGIFIHIATVILFESTDSHKFKAQKVLTVLLGFVIAYLTITLGHHHH
jgi:zinc and cadmium transporter